MVPSILLVLLFVYKHHLSLTHHNLNPFSTVKFKISVYNDHKKFHLEVMRVLQYIEKLRAIKIAFTDQTLLCVYDDLFSHGCYILSKKGKIYVIDREFWFSQQ